MPDPAFDLISPVSMHRPNGYSHLARVKRGVPVFIAGQVALDTSGHLVGAGDFRAQAQQVFENLKHAVEAAGGAFSNIVKLNVYVVDRTRLPEYREVRDRLLMSAIRPPAQQFRWQHCFDRSS